MSFNIDASSLALIFRKIRNNMVAKEDGKGLSTNDFTSEEKSKLAGIAAGATKVTKTSELQNDSGFITTGDIPEGAAASTTVPKMNGTAAIGSELAFARGDHVHPSDTSRVPVSRTINGKTLDANITLTAADVGAATADDVATAKQEAIEAVLGENVSADFDTLQEVATWIQNDTTNSTELINRVAAIEGDYVKASELTSLTETEIDAAWNEATTEE